MRSLQHALLKRGKIFAFLFGVAALSTSAFSQEERPSIKDALGLTGSLRAAGFEHDKSGLNDYGYLVNGLWLNARPQEFYGFSSVFDYRIQGQNLTRNTDTDDDLREAYLERTVGNFDFKAGRFITVWGRADKVNPTDVFSSRNYNLLVTDDEDQRLGTFATQIAYYMDNYRLVGLWQPEWRQPEYPIGKLPQGVEIGYGLPKNREQQFGFKLDHSGSVDWSVSYSHTIDRGPDIKVASMTAQSQAFKLDFNPIHVVGMDIAVPVGDYGLRGEVAYTKTKDSNGNDPTIKNSNIFAVVGIERTFDGVFNVNLQYLFRHTVDFKDPDSFSNPADQATALYVGIFNNQLKENFSGATLRLNHKAFNETLESEVTLINWFYDESYGFLRPKITYSFSDTFRGAIGYEYYYGPEATLFGRMKDMSSGFTEVRWLF